jgi:hypothetical protein
MKEFVATVTLPKGGMQSVTVKARDTVHAKSLLERMGYLNVRNIG